MSEAQTLAPQAHKPPAVIVGGQVAALIPQNLDEAFRVAKAFHASGLAPQSLKSPEAILVSVMAGAELGFAPYQSMQSFAVINNRASIWGDAIPALLWARGFDIEEWFDDDDHATKAYCKVTRPSGKEITRTFSIDDAKKAGLAGKTGPWQTAQKRMLQMRARAFAARDGAADVLRGLPVYEEVQDYAPIRDVTPAPSGLAARLAGAKGPTEGFNASQAADHNPETGEVIGQAAEPIPDADFVENAEAIVDDAQAESDFPGDRKDPERPAQVEQTAQPNLAERAATYEARLKSATNGLTLKAYQQQSKQLLKDLDASDPERKVELDALFDERALALEEERKAAGQ